MSEHVERLLPAATVARLQALIQERDRITGLIDITITTAKEVLDVPAEWVIRDIREGFVPPGVSGVTGE